MSLQGYDTIYQNAVSSFNTKMRVVCQAASVLMPAVATISASPAPTNTVFTVSNAAILQVGSPIFVEVSGTPELTRISALNGAVVTVPALSGAPDSAGNVWLAIDWQPDGARPKKPTYPFVSAQFLRSMSPPDKNQTRFRSRLQIDVFSNDAGPATARRVAGLIMSGLGFDPDSIIKVCEIPQIDSERTPAIPLLPMDLEYARGFEDFGDSDPNVTHLLAEFNLYHE